MDVDVEEGFVAVEEEFPERGEVEIGVGEEEEGDFGLRVGSAEAGDGVVVVVVEERRGGGEGGAAEEGEVVELVGEGDLDVFGREESGGE